KDLQDIQEEVKARQAKKVAAILTPVTPFADTEKEIQSKMISEMSIKFAIDILKQTRLTVTFKRVSVLLGWSKVVGPLTTYVKNYPQVWREMKVVSMNHESDLSEEEIQAAIRSLSDEGWEPYGAEILNYSGKEALSLMET